MITYAPFWNTLEEKGISTYSLIHKHHFSSNTIDRMRKNEPITTATIDKLCTALDCSITDVLEYVR